MGREQHNSKSKSKSKSEVAYNVYNGTAPSSSQGSATPVSSYYGGGGGDDDDIYSDLDTDFDIAVPAPSSSLSMVVGEASDDDDIVFPKFDSLRSPWSCEDAECFMDSPVNDEFLRHLKAELLVNDEFLRRLKEELEANNGEKELKDLRSKMGLNEQLEQLRSKTWMRPHPDNQEGNCQSSQSNFPSEMANPFGTIAGDSIHNLPEKDTDKEDTALSFPLIDENLELNNHELKGGSSQKYKTAKPFSDALASASKSDGMIAGKSISNFTEKDINKENAQSGVGNGMVLSGSGREQEMSAMVSALTNVVVYGEVTQNFVNPSNNRSGGGTSASSSASASLWGTFREYEPLSDFPVEAPSIMANRLVCKPTNCFPMDLKSEYETLRSQILNTSTLPSVYEVFATIDSEECRRRLVPPASSSVSAPPVLADQMALATFKELHKHRSSQTIHPCKTAKPCDDALASTSDGIIAGKSFSNFAEKDINKVNAQPGLPPSMCGDEKLEPRNYEGECLRSQSNCSSKTTKPLEDTQVSNSNRTIAGKSISNLLEKDNNEEDVLSSSPLSTCRDEKLEPNNHKKKCQSYQSNCSSKTKKPVENMPAPDSDGMVAGKSISNLPVKNINEQETLPDEELQPDNHRQKCQGSQSNCPSKMMKPFDGTTESNSNEMVMSESISKLPEKGMTKEDAVADLELSKHGDDKLEPDNHKRKYRSSQSNYPSKAKKTFHNMPASNCDVIITSENISNPEEDSNEEIALPCSSLSTSGATRMSSSTGDQNTFLESQDSHVKLRIKSFTVPEFFVEIPETATVSFLKRKIMEKATAMVGSAHVGVLLQGKKIRDENKTLSEIDISNESGLDVILEPIPSQAPHSCPLQLHCDLFQPLTRYSPTPVVVHQGTSDTSPDPLLCNSGNIIQGDHDLVETQTNMLVGKNTTSMEVIAHPAISVEPLDMGPVHQKSSSSKNAQRRNSELFSISEVEALVQAVEELGTGRWKKIREQAFGNASNRTHTDLKDKWRSLVNTAKRPVNKRRGVVLPQVLLDRVLAVETHNSLQQATQHWDDPFSLL